MRYLIKFSYDGTNFIGFQKQPNKRTVQSCIEEAATRVNNDKKVNMVATGRTDKGVHALVQYAHIDIDVDITEYKLKRALNTFLPDDIHIISTKTVNKDFNARYDVKEKTYKYYINTGEYNPITRNYMFQYNHELNIDNMKDCIKAFLGKHDFRAFVTENKEKENCVREIYKATIEEKDNIICITFTGNGFLRYQVRNMVGILIKAGENKINKTDIEKIIESKDRTKSGKTAPAVGLFLTDIKY
jgi:tRNA pseudouridine38-40 synthase